MLYCNTKNWDGYESVEEIQRYIVELGNEGRLISMQLSELIRFIERDGILLIRDYCREGMDYNEIYNEIQKLSSEELVDLDLIAKVLGYSGASLIDSLISPKDLEYYLKFQEFLYQ